MNELSVSRFIAAPPEKVWSVMTDRQDEWWCPTPWRAEVQVQDRRAGGRSEMTMFGPEGEVIPQNGIFLEWTEGKRFIATDAVIIDPDSGDPVPSGPFMIGIWEIAPASEGGVEGTLYTARARHWTEEDCKRHDEMGFVEGWKACAEQLAQICESESVDG